MYLSPLYKEIGGLRNVREQSVEETFLVKNILEFLKSTCVSYEFCSKKYLCFLRVLCDLLVVPLHNFWLPPSHARVLLSLFILSAHHISLESKTEHIIILERERERDFVLP